MKRNDLDDWDSCIGKYLTVKGGKLTFESLLSLERGKQVTTRVTDRVPGRVSSRD